MKLFHLINNKNKEIKIIMRYSFVFTLAIVFDSTRSIFKAMGLQALPCPIGGIV